MKYIMLRRKDRVGEQQDVPIIFPDLLVHSEVAKALRQTFQLSRSEVVSAGRCEVVATSTHGHSETLKLEARDEDARTINCYDYAQGQDLPANVQTERLVLVRTARLIVERYAP